MKLFITFVLASGIYVVALQISYVDGCAQVSTGGDWERRRSLISPGETLNYSHLLDGLEHPALLDALRAYDYDNDGALSPVENRALLEKASEYFDGADLNQDGELSPAELQAFVRQLAGLSANEVFTPEEQKKMFSDLDKDNDRALSRKELGEPTLIGEIINVFKSVSTMQ